MSVFCRRCEHWHCSSYGLLSQKKKNLKKVDVDIWGPPNMQVAGARRLRQGSIYTGAVLGFLVWLGDTRFPSWGLLQDDLKGRRRGGRGERGMCEYEVFNMVKHWEVCCIWRPLQIWIWHCLRHFLVVRWRCFWGRTQLVLTKGGQAGEKSMNQSKVIKKKKCIWNLTFTEIMDEIHLLWPIYN